MAGWTPCWKKSLFRGEREGFTYRVGVGGFPKNGRSCLNSLLGSGGGGEQKFPICFIWAELLGQAPDVTETKGSLSGQRGYLTHVEVPLFPGVLFHSFDDWVVGGRCPGRGGGGSGG